MASVTITFSGDGGADDLRAVFAEASGEIAAKLAAKQVENINDRVARREAVSGRTYKASKRVLENKGGSPLTLWDDGDMLKAMKASDFSSDSAKISFGSTREAAKAIFHNNGTRRGLPMRRFFGVGEKDQETLTKQAQKIFKRIMSRRGFGRG